MDGSIIKIMIVDDHKIFRRGLALHLDEIVEFEVVGEAADGKEFLRKIENLKPDVVFMDIDMPIMDGIEATSRALERFPNTKIIALSMHGEEEYLEKMLQAGASGFLLKNAEAEDLVRAVNFVLNGKNYFSPELVNLLANKIFIRSSDNHDEQIKFSKREIEIIRYICEGLSNAEIADKLCLSQRTVENHRAHIIEKTNTRNTVGLVVYAIKNKIYKI